MIEVIEATSQSELNSKIEAYKEQDYELKTVQAGIRNNEWHYAAVMYKDTAKWNKWQIKIALMNELMIGPMDSVQERLQKKLDEIYD